METLIKSPQIGEGTIDLYPPLSPSLKSDAKPAREKREGGPAVAEAAPQVQAPKPLHDASRNIANAADQAAESKLKELLQAQQASLKEAEAKAVSEGFAKGLAEGQRQGEEKYAAAVQALAALIESGKQSVAGLLQESEDIIAAIVFEAVCKIVGKELASIEGCAAAVRQVLAKASTEEVVSVRVSPKDLQRLKDGVASDPDIPGAILASLPLEADDRVELGGCILSLKDGSIDGRIETQFRTFAQSLKDAVKGR